VSKERPILFSGPMVRAILEGRKLQTRRIVKDAQSLPTVWTGDPDREAVPSWYSEEYCPYGKPGDRLWVRETFWVRQWGNTINGIGVDYKAGGEPTHRSTRPDNVGQMCRWRPSIHMPRWASRINLEITEVRVERLQDISENDAYEEGVTLTVPEEQTYYGQFRVLWESINGSCKRCKGHGVVPAWSGSLAAGLEQTANDCPECHGTVPGSWDANPFVWVIEFKHNGGGANG